MNVSDDDLDESLRELAAPAHEVATRVAARALTAPTRGRRNLNTIVIAGCLVCAVLLVMIGVSYWPDRATTAPEAGVPGNVGMVLVRAPDGSSVIISTGIPADQEPSAGTGYVISEGGQR